MKKNNEYRKAWYHKNKEKMREYYRTYMAAKRRIERMTKLVEQRNTLILNKNKWE